MIITPGCHDNHTTTITSGLRLPWLPNLDTITVTPNYQDNHIAPSFHNYHTRLSWLHTTTLAHDHVAMKTTLGCHGNHIPSYHNNQTRLTWRPFQVATATTLVFHCDYMISQRCAGNCNSLLILLFQWKNKTFFPRLLENPTGFLVYI